MTITNEEFIVKLRSKYQQVHPLIFHRSVERADTEVHLFDILAGLPQEYPIIWDETTKGWVHTKDLSQSAKFKILKKKGPNAS